MSPDEKARLEELMQEIIETMSPQMRAKFEFLESLSKEKSARIAEICRETGFDECFLVDLVGQEKIMSDDF